VGRNARKTGKPVLKCRALERKITKDSNQEKKKKNLKGGLGLKESYLQGGVSLHFSSDPQVKVPQ